MSRQIEIQPAYRGKSALRVLGKERLMRERLVPSYVLVWETSLDKSPQSGLRCGLLAALQARQVTKTSDLMREIAPRGGSCRTYSGWSPFNSWASEIPSVPPAHHEAGDPVMMLCFS